MRNMDVRWFSALAPRPPSTMNVEQMLEDDVIRHASRRSHPARKQFPLQKE